jgi:hypothetical protein
VIGRVSSLASSFDRTGRKMQKNKTILTVRGLAAFQTTGIWSTEIFVHEKVDLGHCWAKVCWPKVKLDWEEVTMVNW